MLEAVSDVDFFEDYISKLGCIQIPSHPGPWMTEKAA